MANLLELLTTYDRFREQAASKQAKESAAGAAPPEGEDPPQGVPEGADLLGLAGSPPAARVLPNPLPQMPAPDATLPLPPARPPAAEPAKVPPLTPGEVEAEGVYRHALLSVLRMFEAAAMESIAPGGLLSTVRELAELAPLIVDATATSRDLLRRAMGTYAEGEGFVPPHSVNVAVLGVDLGRELNFERQSLLDLCLAGFTHDVGSVRLPEGLLTKSESLTPSEWAAIRARPTYSYEVLTSLGGEHAKIAEIAHQVYERLDGSGYPKGLKGDEILPEARILGTVDFFESFAHPRPYKTVLPGTANHGIQMLMQMVDQFGADTLKALVGSIGLFPIGSYVQLSSGEIGRVVDVKKDNPMRPEVQVLLNNERRPPRQPRSIDLVALPQVYVSRALTASDLRELGLASPSDDDSTAAPTNRP